MMIITTTTMKMMMIMILIMMMMMIAFVTMMKALRMTISVRKEREVWTTMLAPTTMMAADDL